MFQLSVLLGILKNRRLIEEIVLASSNLNEHRRDYGYLNAAFCSRGPDFV